VTRNSNDKIKYYCLAASFFIPLLSYILLLLINSPDYSMPVRLLMIVWILLSVAVAFLFRKKKKSVAIMIIVIGIIMRTGYMILTPCQVRHNDLALEGFTVTDTGHAGYILRLALEGRLPETNAYELYQQPFFYFLAAGVARFVNFIVPGNLSNYFLTDVAKVVSCTASCITLLVTYQLLWQCGISDKKMVFSIMLTAFSPQMYITGGKVTPDALAVMFISLELLYTFKWMEMRKFRDILLLAIFFGLGVMTKISSGLMALPTATVFVIAFLKKRNDKKELAVLIKQFGLFGIISLPLGLWFGIRNYILFGQSLTYVFPMDPRSPMYNGNLSLLKRFFSLDLRSLHTSRYVDVFTDNNMPVIWLKSAAFGTDDTIKGTDILLNIFGGLTAIIAVIMVLAIVYSLITQRKNHYLIFCVVSVLLFVICQVSFAMKYPFMPSMDFRYSFFIIIPLSVLVGNMLLNCKMKVPVAVAEVIISIFSVLSVMIYCFV